MGSDTQTGAVLVTTSMDAEEGKRGCDGEHWRFDASFLRSHGFPLPTSASTPTSIPPTSVLKAAI